jgi:hypothetical protein
MEPKVSEMMEGKVVVLTIRCLLKKGNART